MRQQFLCWYCGILMSYGDKIEALDTLGFHLMLNGAFKPLDFCKDAQFWRGYQR